MFISHSFYSIHFLIKIVLGFLWIFWYRKIWITLLTTLDITKKFFGSTEFIMLRLMAVFAVSSVEDGCT